MSFERRIKTTFRNERMFIRYANNTFTLSVAADGNATAVTLTDSEARQVRQAISDALWEAENGRYVATAVASPDDEDEPSVGDEVMA